MHLQKRCWEAARVDHLESGQKVAYLHLLVATSTCPGFDTAGLAA